MRTMGRIFSVDAEALIADMRADFDSAAALVSSSTAGSMKAIWLDCVGCGCITNPGPGEERQLFLGAGAGAPNMLMSEAGLTNAFAHIDANWACVNESDIIAAAPDVIVVVDASWDSAWDKLTWLYDRTTLCGMEALQGARLVQIPFSATTLSPRNGPAALDLAIASLHVRTGSVTPVRESGVSSFNLTQFRQHIFGLSCAFVDGKVNYDIIDDTNSNQQTNFAIPNQMHVLWLCALAWLAACY